MTLLFDTETTGLVDFDADLTAEHQPHLVQLAAIVVDEGWNTRASMNVIVRPEGWTIPQEVVDIHGIDQGIATRCGIPRRKALEWFSALCKMTHTVVSYNLAFDERVMWTAFAREHVIARSFNANRFRCAMIAAHEAGIPSSRQSSSRPWPKLLDSYKHVTGVEWKQSHDAMDDVLALKVVAQSLALSGHLPLAIPAP